MSNFYKLFMSFMLVGLMTFSLFALIITSQEDNEISEKFIDNDLINNSYSSLRTDLTSFSNNSQTQKTIFEEENPTAGLGTILLFSIVSSGKVFNSMVIGTFNTLITLPTVFLGLDPIIVSVISTMLIITIIISLWIIYKL